MHAPSPDQSFSSTAKFIVSLFLALAVLGLFQLALHA